MIIRRLYVKFTSSIEIRVDCFQGHQGIIHMVNSSGFEKVLYQKNTACYFQKFGRCSSLSQNSWQQWVLNCKSNLMLNQAVLPCGEEEETSLGRAILETRTLIS